MATLETLTARTYKQNLDSCEEPWLLAVAHPGNSSESDVARGLLGIIDWRLHGKVSKLLREQSIAEGNCAIFSSPNKLGRATLLLYRSAGKISFTALIKNLEQLQVKELCLAEDTFPEDFSSKLKDNLDNAGIRWATLESKKT